MAKKYKATQPSSTKGIAKGLNCQKSPLKTRLAKDSRFHKTDPLNYVRANMETDGLKGNLRSNTTKVYEGEMKHVNDQS